MADKYLIDSHKLHLHPHRVVDWLNNKNIAPIYLEVSPSGGCNHRCLFCGMDFLGYTSRLLPTKLFCQRLGEMGQSGVKSIMFAGEGEPLLHKDIALLAESAKTAGIDIAFTTNAVLLRPKLARRLLPITSWIKVSCNAGSAKTYAHIHGTNSSDFERVMENMAEAVAIRKETESHCVLGFQTLLLPENKDEVMSLAEQVRALGADYLVVKPYSVHRQSSKDAYVNLEYENLQALADALATLKTDSFNVIFRHEAMHRKRHPTTYTHCLALPFWGYIDSAGQLWYCLRHIGEEAFSGGNTLEMPFADLLANRILPTGFPIEDCHVDCRMDPINTYLWELTHPSDHVNFI